MIQSLIAWLNDYSWHQLSTIAQPWTAPVSVLGHSWPTFSPSSFFPLHFVMSRIFLFRPVSKTPRRVSIVSESPSCSSLQTAKWIKCCNYVYNWFLFVQLLQRTSFTTPSLICAFYSASKPKGNPLALKKVVFFVDREEKVCMREHYWPIHDKGETHPTDIASSALAQYKSPMVQRDNRSHDHDCTSPPPARRNTPFFVLHILSWQHT